MQDDDCICYIVGCCPYEEFSVPGVTKTCEQTHNKAFRDEYKTSTQYFSFESQALEILKEIVSDVDKKVTMNNQLLADYIPDDGVFAALAKTEEIINTTKIDKAGTMELYSLLKMHGELIEKAEQELDNTKYSVCTECSAFKSEFVCNHKFCLSYQKVRRIVKEIDLKFRRKNML